MSLLSTITKGRENRPPRLFVYGQEGVGKSLFSASAPNPIFVQTEDGLGEIDTAKFPLAQTLDEVFTVAASATIGYHSKPVILYNIKGFWNPLIQLLDDLQSRGMVRGHWHDYIQVVSKLEELSLPSAEGHVRTRHTAPMMPHRR